MPPALFFIAHCLLVFTASAVGSLIPTRTIQARAGVPTAPGFIFTTGVPGCTNVYITGGRFNYTWGPSNDPNVYCGKGWAKGTNRTIGYSGTYYPQGISELSITGLTRNPDIEYRVIEAFAGASSASSGYQRGIVICNGRMYNLFQGFGGSGLLHYKFWSLRQDAEVSGTVSGTVDMACHFRAWEAWGTKLGTHDFQLVEVDAYYSTGNASITIANYTVPV